MAWFKSDDMLADHPKVIRLGKDMAPAMGVWLLVGTWAARYSTDGFVPDAMVHRYDPRGRLAKRLIEVGLWERTEHDGTAGYRYHDWFDHQLSAEEVEKKRSQNRDRQRRFRNRNGQFGPQPPGPGSGGEQGSDEPDQQERTPDDESNAVTEPSRNGTCNALRNALVTSTPTRPDPYLSTSSGDDMCVNTSFVAAPTSPPRKRASPRGARIPADFAVTQPMVEWAREHAPHVDGRIETEQFIDYWTAKAGRDATKLDWTATWRSWMRKAEQQAGRHPAGTRRLGRRTTDDKIAGLQALKTGTDGPTPLRAITGGMS